MVGAAVCVGFDVVDLEWVVVSCWLSADAADAGLLEHEVADVAPVPCAAVAAVFGVSGSCCGHTKAALSRRLQ